MSYSRTHNINSLLALLAAVSASLATPALGQALCTIPAGDLCLTLRNSGAGVEVERLEDTRTGQTLLAAPSLPLFSLTLQPVGRTNQVQLSADRGWRHCEVQRQRAGFRLRWSQPDDAALDGIAVTATVRPDVKAGALRWQLRLDNTNRNWSVWQVKFPQVALADLGTNAAVFFPRGPGEIQRGVWHRKFSYRGNYPSGWAVVQYMAVYREGDRPTGLYVGQHDPWGGTKDLVVESEPKAGTVRLTFDHLAPDQSRPANSFELEGEGVWQILRGDWFDAALIYKDWARREAKWWPRLARDGRADTPRWLRELNAWAMIRGAPDRCLPLAKEFHELLSQPVGVHWYDWHQTPYDNDYPHYFPTKEGFSQAIAELQRTGVRVMPYINGRLWDTHDRGTEDYQFTQLALPKATKQPGGSPYVETYNSRETNGEPVRLAVMCPSTVLWQNTVSNNALRLLRECGASAVYIDQIGAAAPKPCLDPTHGHPLGGGHWWNQGYWQMLQSIRGAMPAETALTTECNAEPFLAWFDGYLTWHWQNDGQVPAFPAIYGGAIQMFGRLFKGGSTQALALRMKVGQQLVFGEQLGWINPTFLRESASGEFFRQAVRLRSLYSRFFFAGEMARPPKLLGPIPTVRADWQWSGEWWVTTDAVLTGAWKLPKERRLVLFFVNVSERDVAASLRFEPAAYGLRTRSLRWRQTTATDGTGEWRPWLADADRRVALSAHQAQAWEFSW